MADSWEDWEVEEPVVPGAPAPAAAEDPVKSKFEGEDEGEEEEPKWKANVPAPQAVGAAHARCLADAAWRLLLAWRGLPAPHSGCLAGAARALFRAAWRGAARALFGVACAQFGAACAPFGAAWPAGRLAGGQAGNRLCSAPPAAAAVAPH